MSRSTSKRIADILQSIENCQNYLDFLGGDGLLSQMAEDAIERNLQIIGEAVKGLPVDLTSNYSYISWLQIRGFRNILVHEYFGIDYQIVKDVVINYLPPLKEALEDYQQQSKEEKGP